MYELDPFEVDSPYYETLDPFEVDSPYYETLDPFEVDSPYYDESYWEGTFTDLGIDVYDVVQSNEYQVIAEDPDIKYVIYDDGSIMTTDGELVAPSQQTWAESFYVDENGNVRDWTGQVVASAQEIENEKAANPTLPPEKAAVRAVARGAVAQGGQTGSNPNRGAVSDNRRAQTPPAAPTTKTPETTLDRIERYIDKALGYDLKRRDQEIRQAQGQGRATPIYRPEGPTNRYGTPLPQRPGQTVNTADGRTIRNVGNGMVEITYPDGRKETKSARSLEQGSSALGTTGLVVLGGLGLLAVLALTGRRSSTNAVRSTQRSERRL